MNRHEDKSDEGRNSSCSAELMFSDTKRDTKNLSLYQSQRHIDRELPGLSD